MKFGKKLTLLLTLASAFISFNSKAQYGNEWINYDQTYYKIKIGAEGIYRIDFQTLSDIGVPVSTLNPKNFQLFLNGEELHIYVGGEADEVFDSTDFIEFYGKKNDGWLDKELYRTPEEQPNPLNSLYSDTSIYFLTWNNRKDNKRIDEFYDASYIGKTSDPFFLHEVTYYKTTNYFSGIPNNNDGAQLFSEYTDGEGFHEWIWQTQALFSLPTPKVYVSGPNAKIDILAYTSNHNTSTIVNNYNHEFGVSIKNKSNLIASKKTLGFERIKISKELNNLDLEAVTKVYAGELTFSGSGINLSYIKLTYPRLLDLNNSETLKIGPTTFNTAYFNFKNYPTTKSKPIIYDFKNKQRIIANKSGTSIEFNLSKAGNDVELYIFDETNAIKLNTSSFSPAPMIDLNIDVSSDYLIISHKKLQSGAEKYKTYRESSSGGNYAAHIVFTDDLYNQHSYGYLHPLAIKHYLDQQTAQSNSLEHILLLGKGQLYTRDRTNNALREAYNLVPPIGIPASDMLYVGDLSASTLKTKVSIGRVPARDNNQIDIYLDKLDAFENSPNEEWKKKIIQLAGGTSPSENAQYKFFLNNYLKIATDTSFGGYGVMFSKNDPVPVQTSITGVIQEELNKGSSLLSYFGHGAAQVTEISLGEPDQLSNYSKTPLFLFNGCALGNTYEDLSLAEKFLFEEKNGAIGWIASSNFGFTFSLYNHTYAIYRKLFQDNYGAGIGVAMKEALNIYGNPNNSLDVMEARQLIYHGDPALLLYVPDKPDYLIERVEVSQSLSEIDSTQVKIRLKNLGKALNEELTISCNLKNNSNQLIFSNDVKFKAPYFNETVYITIPKDELEGLIKMEFILDKNNDISELEPNGELNNTFNYEYLFQGSSPTIIYPLNNAIISSNYPELVVKIPSNARLLRDIEIEWDTTPYFKNPLGKIDFQSDARIVSKNILLPLLDRKDYFVRCRYKEQSKVSPWGYRTFGLIANDNEGVTQGDYWKFDQFNQDFLFIDTLTRDYKFLSALSRVYQTQTTGSDLGRFSWRYTTIDGEPIIINWGSAFGVDLTLIHPLTEKRYMENSTFNVNYPKGWWTGNPSDAEYEVVGKKSGSYNYNCNIDAIQDSLIAFLNRVPDGYYLMMRNAHDNKMSLWKDEVWQALELFGITKLRSADDKEPFAIFGQKGALPDPAVEIFGDRNDIVNPPSKQAIEYAYQFPVPGKQGSFETGRIGPAKKWENLTLSFKEKDSDSDSFNIKIYGQNNLSQWFELSSTTDSSYDLASIDAKLYPYLKFKVELFDPDKRTPLQLERWKINYQAPTEGVLLGSENDTIKQIVQEGEKQILSSDFINISTKQFDSSNYIVYVKNAIGSIDTLINKPLSSLQPKQSKQLQDTFDTRGMNGTYELFAIVNPNKNVLENDYNNNIFHTQFKVNKDNTNPLLDVTFDEIHILDNDIVSPTPTIRMTLMDDNEYLKLSNSKNIDFTLYLINADNSKTAISIDTSETTFIPASDLNNEATLIYRPTKLSSGLYELEVNGNDESGNNSSELSYQITFTVIEESSITNLYPYPNPFTSSTRFVFTLTGSEIPEYFKIQIMTVSGKIVREITKNELGNIKIGNNISEFSWNGTDEFGDQLANGVYLYKVISRLNGENIPLRESTGDQYFQAGVGKIYLMR